MSVFTCQNGLLFLVYVSRFVVVVSSNTLAGNVLGLCEVAENRSGKFRFRRHVAKANSYLLNYEKKPIKLAFADYEAQTFNLDCTPPFCKTLVS
jgi:hypothetical protein